MEGARLLVRESYKLLVLLNWHLVNDYARETATVLTYIFEKFCDSFYLISYIMKLVLMSLCVVSRLIHFFLIVGIKHDGIDIVLLYLV